MNNGLFTRRSSWLVISLVMCLSLVFPGSLLLPEPVIAEGGTFPASPFNGMQITYSVSGATITDTEDSEGFTTSRTLSGTLGTGELTVSGSAKMGNGYDADVIATVSCGGETDEFTTNIESGFPDFNEESFSISVPIPQGATSGSFSINMTGHYNAGDRGLVVSGTFGADSGASVPSSTPAQTTQDPPPGPLIEELPPVDWNQKNLSFIETVEGNPIYVSADSSDLPPSQRNWVEIMPGDYKGKGIMIGEGWTVRTPGGAETVMRGRTGVVWRQKERTWFESHPRVAETTPTSVVMGRLWQGIANFYFPKGQAGADKFEVSLTRVHTGIKGTNFVVEVTEQSDIVKVIEGTVEVTHDDTGNMKTLEAGDEVTATVFGLGDVSSFDVTAEKSKWGSFYAELEDDDSLDSTSGGGWFDRLKGFWDSFVKWVKSLFS